MEVIALKQMLFRGGRKRYSCRNLQRLLLTGCMPQLRLYHAINITPRLVRVFSNIVVAFLIFLFAIFLAQW